MVMARTELLLQRKHWIAGMWTY